MSEVEWFDQEQIERVDALWAKVFEHSNLALHQHSKFGFLGIEVIPRPTVHEMLENLGLLKKVIDAVLSVKPPNDQIRLLLNAQKQIANMEKLASALNAKSKEDYDAAVGALSTQAVF